jgi:hypothetical protein
VPKPCFEVPVKDWVPAVIVILTPLESVKPGRLVLQAASVQET